MIHEINHNLSNSIVIKDDIISSFSAFSEHKTTDDISSIVYNLVTEKNTIMRLQ